MTRSFALAALMVLSAAAPAPADEAPAPPPKRQHRAAAPRHRAPAVRPDGGAAPALRPASADAEAERAASLERRRKAFFAPKPDDTPRDGSDGPPVGVTLGGSGGLSPGLGLKF